MSTIVEQERSAAPEGAQAEPCRDPMLPDGRANTALLEDQLPPALKAPRELVILTAAVGVVYFCLSRLAIRASDVWGHLAYGRWILEHHRLPETEPLLPLCQGVPWVDTAWLAKIAGVWTFEQFGIAGLQFLHAATLSLAFAICAWCWQQRTARVGWTLAGLLAFGLIDYQQLLIQRPQDFGVAAFAATFAWALRDGRGRFAWFALPLLFALWANVHGSFMVGLGLLGASALGRAIDVYRHSRSLRLTLRSRLVWRAVLMTELCAAAVLLNPAGLGIYADVLAISNNPNLPTLLDWSPLNLRMGQGQIFAAAVVLLACLYRFSPRRVTAFELIVLVGLGLSALWSLRMLIWWGPIAGYCIAVHGAAAWRACCRQPLVPAASERRGLWTVATIGLAWIFFAYSPFGLQRIHGRPTGEAAQAEFRRGVIDRTPLDAVDYLVAHADQLPSGLMYNSQEFGDYLLWAAPSKFGLFVNSHVHLIPREVWQDFLEIHDAGGNWSDKLDRYGVNTVLVDTTNYMGLIRALRDDDRWREAFVDPQGMAVLFVRKRPV